jgi:hypothetical protein
MAGSDIELPYDWTPRAYQWPLWEYLCGGGRNAIEIAHRRWGKDELVLNFTAVAAHQRIASYVHFLPQYSQARKALWEMVNPHTGKRRIEEAFPDELIQDRKENEMFIRFKCGSTWQLAGSDNYNALMGTSFAGMAHSEYALADPAAHGYFAPILMENNGWQVFITTPRGKNHAKAMYDYAREARARCSGDLGGGGVRRRGLSVAGGDSGARPQGAGSVGAGRRRDGAHGRWKKGPRALWPVPRCA